MKRRLGRRRVVQYACREDRVEGFGPERRMKDVALHEVQALGFAEPPASDIDRRRNVEADPVGALRPSRREPCRSGETRATARIEDSLTGAEPIAHLRGRL